MSGNPLRRGAIKAGVESRLWPDDNLTEAARTVESILDALLDYLEETHDLTGDAMDLIAALRVGSTKETE